VGGVPLLGVRSHTTPHPPPLPPPDRIPEAPPLPTATIQVARALRAGFRTGLAGVRALAAAVRDPRPVLHELGALSESLGEIARIALSSVPPTPFNGHVSTLRRVAWTTFSLNEVKAVKNRLGGTVNDVVLATISAALRAYLERRDIKLDRIELRAMLPVNVRRPGGPWQPGNRASLLAAPLPVGIFDPLGRSRQVRAATGQLKEGGQAARMTRLVELLELLPPLLQKPVAWLQVQAPPVNTVCTNVPGPPVALYVQGHRLETLVPVVPLAHGIRIALASLSHPDTL